MALFWAKFLVKEISPRLTKRSSRRTTDQGNSIPFVPSRLIQSSSQKTKELSPHQQPDKYCPISLFILDKGIIGCSFPLAKAPEPLNRRDIQNVMCLLPMGLSLSFISKHLQSQDVIRYSAQQNIDRTNYEEEGAGSTCHVHL
jgi:hypothetical protein